MKTFWTRRLPLAALFALLLTVTCAGAASAQSIRKIDFRNFTYHADCAYENAKNIRVRNGKYTQDKGDDKLFFTVEPAAYGDLTGDGVEEAVIQSGCNTGGSGDFSEGFLYTMHNGKPVLLTTVPGGDRADGGLHRLSIQRGLLVVETYDHKTTSGACCPDYIDTRRYRWNGNKLEQVGGKQRRAYKQR